MASGSSQGARPQQDTYTSLTLARTQQVTVVLPVIGLLGVLVAVLAMSEVMPRYYAVAIIFAVASLAIIVFSRTVFKVLDRLQSRLRRQNQQLRALYLSSLAASAHLSLKAILQTVADSSRELARARYTIIFVGDGENVEHVIGSGATPEETRILELLMPNWTEQLLEDGQAYRTADLGADARVKLPRSFPTIKSFLAVPLLSQGNAIGYFVATDKDDDGEFDDEDQAMIETFAVQAAVAVENVRLQKAAQDAAALRERERIALDLHDGVIQQLYGIGLRLESGLEGLEAQPEAVRADIDGAIEGLNSVIRDVRSHIFHLQPNQLQGRGFTEALSQLLEELSVNALIRTDLVVDLEQDPSDGLSPDQTERLVAVARQALDNVRRHSQAYNVRAEVERKAGLLNMRIVDDGIGIPQDKLESEEAGLGHMRENARLLRGHLSVEAEAQGGTAVTLTIPLDGQPGG
jgi:signal transduction histidine kinase